MIAFISKQRDWRAFGVWSFLAILMAIGWWIDAHGMSHGWPIITTHQRTISVVAMVLAVLSAWSIAAWIAITARTAHTEDAKWSRNYARHIAATLSDCTIHLAQRTVSVEFTVTNTYTKSRRTWIAANVAVYGRDPKAPLFVLPVPVVSADIDAGSSRKLSATLSATVNAADAALALAQYNLDGKLQAKLIDATVATVANMTTSAQMVKIDVASEMANAQVFT